MTAPEMIDRAFRMERAEQNARAAGRKDIERMARAVADRYWKAA